MSDLFKSLKDFFGDPKNIEDMARHFKAKAHIKLHNMERMKKFFHDDESFDSLMLRIIRKHGNEWDEICRRNGVQPHPWHILYSILDIAEEEGKEVDPIDSFTRGFHSMLWEYRGWTFAITHGQGSVTSIYRGDLLIYRD
jgi:hypothetical protein